MREDTALEIVQTSTPLTTELVNQMNERIALMREFVSSQMVENIHYGVVPGTKKKSLWQPGAQLLARLFDLSVTKTCTHREISRELPYIEFSYKATVTNRTGRVIAECEGSCNSGEVKYKFAANRLGDVLNTLQKMAQKRAFVGAIIEACAASDYFTQDIDSPEDARALGLKTRETVQVKTPKYKAPKVVSSTSVDQTENVCDCGSTMMISKFNSDELYCNPKQGGCGAKRPRGEQ